jgi:hypothetical protein
MSLPRRGVAIAQPSQSIGDVVVDNQGRDAQSTVETTRPADQPTDVAGVMALVQADFWKMPAQMLIYHQEKVAALDRLYETLYGESPSEPRKKRRRRSSSKP